MFAQIITRLHFWFILLVTLFKSLFRIRQNISVHEKQFPQSPVDVFKFYSDDEGDFNARYKPLTADDYKKFITSRAYTRKPELIRSIVSLVSNTDKELISLAGGMPSEEVFPFSKLILDLKGGGALVMEGDELGKAMQYIPSNGYPGLISSLSAFQAQFHRPPALESPRAVLATCGAQHVIYLCGELLVEPGDPVIVSQYAYPGISSVLRPCYPEFLGIPEDNEGMIAETLQSILWDRLSKGLKMPKLLYIIPTGNNPSGVLTSEKRRREIYELACKYDFLILEDDPYLFLNYTERQVPSFLSMDSCGRVLRADSLSKVVSAGLRAGWVTGPAPLVQQMELHIQCEILHSCTLSQAIILQLLSDKASLVAHLQAVRELYRARRDALQVALIAERVAEVAEWSIPDAGLFLWLQVKEVDDVYNMVFRTAFEHGLMLIPGQAFQYDTATSCVHVRLSFSKVPLQQMRQAARLLVDIIRVEQRRTLEQRRAVGTQPGSVSKR